MTQTIREQIARQLELEDEARALGAPRYRFRRPLPWRTEASSPDDEADLPSGRPLLKLAIEPTAQAVREFVERIGLPRPPVVRVCQLPHPRVSGAFKRDGA